MSYSNFSIAGQFELRDIGNICENSAILCGEGCGAQAWT